MSASGNLLEDEFQQQKYDNLQSDRFFCFIEKNHLTSKEFKKRFS